MRQASSPDAGVPALAYAYTLVRSHRKTLAIHITRDATVEVRAPMHMSLRYIERFIASKEKWIESRLASREKVREEKAAFALDYGDTLMFRGEAFPISAREGGKLGFDGTCFYMPPNLSPEQIKAGAIWLYKELAKQVVSEKIENYVEIMQVTPARFRITSAKTRWGSCSAKKNLNFSWRLMMADDPVIDYVVVHELAHLLELNHSPRFWAHVEKVVPAYKERKAQLQQLQDTLSMQNWD